MNYQIDVRVTAPINETEVSDRVVRAVEAIFPEAELTVQSDQIKAETHDVDRFRELLEQQRILDTARAHLRNARHNETISFALKKQAAFHETVNFAVGNPDELGDISVTITVTDPDVATFIEYLAPPTDEDGAPVRS